MPSQIFFDLDGPLIDISEKFYKLYTDIFVKHHQPTLSSREYWELKRNKVPEPDIVSRTTDRDFASKYVPERLAVIEDLEYLKFDRLHPGVVDLLAELKRKGDLTLVTLRNNRRNLLWELEHLGLSRYFANILTKDDNHGDFRIKVELISEFCSNNSCQGILIGDTEADILAAKALKITSCGVTFGIRTKEIITKLEPDFIADSVIEMGQIINQVVGE